MKKVIKIITIVLLLYMFIILGFGPKMIDPNRSEMEIIKDGMYLPINEWEWN